MATYDNLPVYKESYDLLLLVFEQVKQFEKQYKYTLGDRIKNEIIDVISHIYKANGSFEKRVAHIIKAREHLEVVRLYMRLCRDLKILNLKKFADITLDIEMVSKQLFSWQKASEKR